MNAEQVSLTHYVILSLSIQIPEHKRLLVRSYLYLGRSNEWPGRKLMDSSDLSGWSRWCRQWFVQTVRENNWQSASSRSSLKVCNVSVKP